MSTCSGWDPDVLPFELVRGYAYCRHTLCLGHMLASGSAQVDATPLVSSPVHFMSHQYFPLRLAAAELFVAVCSQLATTHVLEGAACLAAAANQTESHDIAVRWMGVEALSRMLSLTHVRGAEARSALPSELLA